VLNTSDAETGFDEEAQSYCVNWESIIIGPGKTKQKALRYSREAVNLNERSSVGGER
jgi:hypothetical protein